jgi:3-hydroxyacyl-CoA dehydrogenase/enoyl-CoA hydratase/3-hydroxybutyryl-CoA epimerase
LNDPNPQPLWRVDVDERGIAWLRFDTPGQSANTLSERALRELDGLLAEIERLAPKGVVVCSGKPRGFIAGADIREFSKLDDPQRTYELVRAGQQVLARLEALPCPTVAAINGFALGGGLELALACRYRVAADSDAVRLGLPEVMLGIHPGFGGTVRAVRTIGPLAAMDLMLTGRNLRADRALAIGLVDRVVPSERLESAAAELALAAPAPARPSLKARLANLGPARPLIASQMRKQVARRARQEHYPAPYALIDLWQRYGADPRTGYEAEARSIAELFRTPTSRNLVRVFFLQERLKGLGAQASRKVERVHVVGAGVMGGDIAAWCALRGLDTTVQDRSLDLVQPALARAKALFEKRLRDESSRTAALARLAPDVEGASIGRADLVIEAISENVDAKRGLFGSLEPRLAAESILATNTSSLMLEQLTEGLEDPGRLVGLHFFNPVAKMPLVEVVHGPQTLGEILERALAFVRQIDKLPLPCRSAPGFVVNRVLVPYMAEALHLADEGAALASIDRAAVRFGMPMGPVELADTVGLDVALHVGRILAGASGRTAPEALVPLVEAGKLGRKSGEGLYRWENGKPVKPTADGPVPADMEDRLILPMLNEAVAVLREGVVTDADMLDAGVIFGTGFAPFRGGPLHYARERGVDEIVAKLDDLTRRCGPRFAPDPGWKQLG